MGIVFGGEPTCPSGQSGLRDGRGRWTRSSCQAGRSRQSLRARRAQVCAVVSVTGAEADARARLRQCSGVLPDQRRNARLKAPGLAYCRLCAMVVIGKRVSRSCCDTSKRTSSISDRNAR